METFESALVTLEADAAEAQKAVDALGKVLRRIRQSARTGHIADLEKALAAIAPRAHEAAAAAERVPGTWTFDARSYIGQGYVEELHEAAADAGLKLIEKNGRLYSFPLLLRIDPREVAVRIGKKTERRIRPRELVRTLLAIQKRPQRASEQSFLDRLHRAYLAMARAEWRKLDPGGVGPAISLVEMHGLLTLMLPGSEYPIEEFGRDLLLLDRKPDLRTREGSAFEFPGATLSKGSMRQISVYDENGNERVYIAIRFVKER